jgi:hypothetical protein
VNANEAICTFGIRRGVALLRFQDVSDMAFRNIWIVRMPCGGRAMLVVSRFWLQVKKRFTEASPAPASAMQPGMVRSSTMSAAL